MTDCLTVKSVHSSHTDFLCGQGGKIAIAIRCVVGVAFHPMAGSYAWTVGDTLTRAPKTDKELDVLVEF
jgi:hypothetical protein